MKITRDVILDLLPLYLEGEVSTDTNTLVEEYLETDRELAELVKRKNKIDAFEDIPISITKEDQMEAYKQAQKMINQRTIMWGAVIAVAILAMLGLALLAFFMLTSVM